MTIFSISEIVGFILFRKNKMYDHNNDTMLPAI